MSNFIELPQFEIRKPCHENWDAMTGDGASQADKKRHCAMCEKSVFNLSEMTRAEVNGVLSSNESVCVRMQKRADGSIVTKQSSPGLFSRVSAVLVSVVASLTLAGCARDTTPANSTSPAPLTGKSVVPAPMGEVEMGDICVIPEEGLSVEEAPMIMGRVRIDRHQVADGDLTGD